MYTREQGGRTGRRGRDHDGTRDFAQESGQLQLCSEFFISYL